MLASRGCGALVVLVALSLATQATADELGASQVAHGFVIHEAGETLRDYCASDASGTLWLTLPDGARFELITSTADAAIANPGDGAFHPFEASEVRAALAATGFPVAAVSAEVFLLPYPRRAQLESAAGPGLILLSPGVRALTREHQHAEFVHELRHRVHYGFFPARDA